MINSRVGRSILFAVCVMGIILTALYKSPELDKKDSQELNIAETVQTESMVDSVSASSIDSETKSTE